MKILITIMLCAFTLTCLGQQHNYDSGCYMLKFTHKKYVDSSQLLTPNFHPKGFYLVTNKVYDLVVDGKLYACSLILKIEADRFFIATKWESADSIDRVIDTLTILPNQKIQLRLLTINNGLGGLPFRTKSEDYNISIVPAQQFCFAKYNRIEIEKHTYTTHQYFTQYPNKNIRIQKSRAFFIDERGEFPLAKN